MAHLAIRDVLCVADRRLILLVLFEEEAPEPLACTPRLCGAFVNPRVVGHRVCSVGILHAGRPRCGAVAPIAPYAVMG